MYWAPKILGRLVPEAGARLVALLLLVGTVVWAFPDLVSGSCWASPAIPGVVPTDNLDTIEALNTVSAIGGVVLALGGARRSSACCSAAPSEATRDPGDDPWSGHTLEWATSSPPPAGNFASLPVITSEAPLYDARHQPEEATA